MSVVSRRVFRTYARPPSPPRLPPCTDPTLTRATTVRHSVRPVFVFLCHIEPHHWKTATAQQSRGRIQNRLRTAGAATRGQDVISRIKSPPTGHPGSSGTPLTEPSQAESETGVTPLTGVVEAETGDVPCFGLYDPCERGNSYRPLIF